MIAMAAAFCRVGLAFLLMVGPDVRALAAPQGSPRSSITTTESPALVQAQALDGRAVWVRRTAAVVAMHRASAGVWLTGAFSRGQTGFKEWLERPGLRSIFLAGVISASVTFAVKLSAINIKSMALVGVLSWLPAFTIYSVHHARLNIKGMREKSANHSDVREWRARDKFVLALTILSGAVGQLLYYDVLGPMTPYSFSFLLVAYPFTNIMVSRLFKEHLNGNGERASQWHSVVTVFYLCFAALGLRAAQEFLGGGGIGSWTNFFQAIGYGVCAAFFQIGTKLLTNPPSHGGRGLFLPPRAFSVWSSGFTTLLLATLLVVNDPGALGRVAGHAPFIWSAIFIALWSTGKLFWNAHNQKAIRTEPLSQIAVAQLLAQQQTHAVVNVVGNAANKIIELPALFTYGMVEAWTVWDVLSIPLTFWAALQFFGQTVRRKAASAPPPPMDWLVFLRQRVDAAEWPEWEAAVRSIEVQLRAIKAAEGDAAEALARRMIGEQLQNFPPASRRQVQMARIKEFVTQVPHGLTHSLIVFQLSASFARGSGKPLSMRDMTTLMGISLYHDMTATASFARAKHHISAAKLAMRILSNIYEADGTRRYDDAQVEAISQGILHHRDENPDPALGLLILSFLDADEFAALDLQRIADSPKHELYNPDYWDIYRRVVLEGAPLYGGGGRFKHSTDTHKEMFRFLSSFVYRANPNHYHTPAAKERVRNLYPALRRQFKQIIHDLLKADGMNPDIFAIAWEAIEHQLIQLEAIIRQDPQAMAAMRQRMQLPDDASAAQAELLERIAQLTDDLLLRDAPASSTAFLKFQDLLKTPRAQRSKDSVIGERIMNEYLAYPEFELDQRLRAIPDRTDERMAGFAYALVQVAKDSMLNLFRMTSASETVMRLRKTEDFRALGEVLATYFLRHVVERNIDAGYVAGLIRGELSRLADPGLQPPLHLTHAIPMPSREALAAAA